MVCREALGLKGLWPFGPHLLVPWKLKSGGLLSLGGVPDLWWAYLRWKVSGMALQQPPEQEGHLEPVESVPQFTDKNRGPERKGEGFKTT